MIQCPKCGNNLPDWSQSCQFCQTDLKNVARPKPAPGNYPRNQNLVQTAPWIWPTYYIIAGYWVLSGLKDVISAALLMSKSADNVAGERISSLAWIGVVIGLITLLTGIGLIAKVEFIRGFVNIICWLQIAGNLCGTVGIILAGSLMGPAVLIGLIFSVFNIATAALMIYLIGETD